MTIKASTPAPSQKVEALWHSLNYALAGIFDAHGVCAAVAYEIAVHTGFTTIVSISDPQRQYYDVWICDSNGHTDQTRWEDKKATFEAILDAGEAVRLDKFERPPAELLKSELWQLPQDSLLAVPIPYPDSYNPSTPPGIICLIDPDDNSILNEKNLEPLASNITVYLDRAYLRHQTDRQDVEFAVVSDISYTLTSTLSLPTIFKQLTGSVRRTLNVEELSVGLRDSNGDIEFVKAVMGARFQDMPPIRLKRGQGIGGWVAENQQPVIINDTYSDDRFYSRVDKKSGFHTDSMICIPLQVEDRTIGILQAINKQTGNFTQHDLRLLQAIGGSLAAAIENARLHQDVIAEKRRIETIFASMSEGMLTTTATGIVTHANDALLSLLQTKASDLNGRSATDIIRLLKTDFQSFTNTVMEAEEDYPQLAADLQQNSGAYVPVLISGAPVQHEDGQINEMIFVFSDLRQIREVERMRDDFFHGIVHELRTPLATILMYARLLREGKAQQKEKQDRFLGVIERESDRLQQMVRQMLQLAKQEARELQRSSEPVSMNSFFKELLPPLADQATQKGLTFRQRIQPDMPYVIMNPDTLHLVFKNLVENAIKFTPTGTVQVSARTAVVTQVGEQIEVQVRDEGIGIPKHAIPNLFQRFYRTQLAVERGIAGTGLGLYMVKQSVENANGTIQVQSEEGRGTTFTIRLPIA
ncbi:MAG: ATP-binding protein [Chloroflexota bacterium]